MSDSAPRGDIVCPAWNRQDHRFVARHYAAYPRKCRTCGCEVAVSRQKKKQADAENLRFICEQCDLQANSNLRPE
jgi:hypothetical protein